MAKSKKTADNSKVEARPIGEGKDPLAEGNTLANPTNSEAETHYDVKEKSEDVQAASQIAGQDANERAEEHNAQTAVPSDVPNSDAAEQDQVAEGRTEVPADETPAEEAVETPAEEAAEPTAPEAPVDESPAEEAVETPAEEASEPAPAVPTEADLEI